VILRYPYQGSVRKGEAALLLPRDFIVEKEMQTKTILGLTFYRL